jgi:hypothetical protein
MTPLNRPLHQLVYAETGQGLAHLIVDGVVVMRDGQLARVDEAALIERIHAAAEALDPAIRAAEETVGRIRTPYEAIFRRCCDCAIPDGIFPTKITGNEAG